MIDVLKEAKQKGMVIIAVDTNVYDGNDFIDYTVVSDNYHAGGLVIDGMQIPLLSLPFSLDTEQRFPS